MLDLLVEEVAALAHLADLDVDGHACDQLMQDISEIKIIHRRLRIMSIKTRQEGLFLLPLLLLLLLTPPPIRKDQSRPVIGTRTTMLDKYVRTADIAVSDSKCLEYFPCSQDSTD